MISSKFKTTKTLKKKKNKVNEVFMRRQSGRTTKQRRASLRKAIGEVSKVNRALNEFVSCSKEGGGGGSSTTFSVWLMFLPVNKGFSLSGPHSLHVVSCRRWLG